MKKTWMVMGITFSLLFGKGTFAKSDRPVVAVFNAEAKRIQLSKELLDLLSDYLATRLTETGAYEIVPRAELKKQRAPKAANVLDQSLIIARALSADKALLSEVFKVGSNCTVSATLFNVETAKTDAAATSRCPCDEDSLQNSLDALVSKLVGQIRAAAASAATEKTPSSPAPPAAVTVDLSAPPGMMAIPAGDFWMGCNPQVDTECESDEKPGHRIYLDAFAIDKSEVTVEEYAKCVKASLCPAPDEGNNCNWGEKGREKHPINCVEWSQASAYCQWVGKKLPSEAEWEKAARGTDGRSYPWGNEPASCQYAVMNEGGSGCGKGSTWPVCSKPKGNSPYGLCDMAGNVFEWVGDWYVSDYYSSTYEKNPRGPGAGEGRVLRSGSWGGNPAILKTFSRNNVDPGQKAGRLGFRCARPLGR